MPDAAGLWLGALRALIHATAHEIRNPLNGVALNLEVIVARTQRKSVPAESLAGFAAAAAQDLRQSISLVDALLDVNRSLSVPTEIPIALKPLAQMAQAVTAARGGSLIVALPDDIAVYVESPGDEVRGALAAALLPGALEGADMLCRVVYEPLEVIVSIETETTPADPLDQGAVAGMAACGIGLELESHAIRLRFPRDQADAR